MQVFSKSENRSTLSWVTKLEGVPGGITVAVLDLTQAGVSDGTPVGKDANGLYHVIKTARVRSDAGATDSSYTVDKGHNLRKGDFITNKVGAKAYAITNIDTSGSDRDVITLSATLGVTVKAGEVLFEAKGEATTNASTFRYEPWGLVGTSFDVVAGDSHLTDCIVRGTIREANIPPIHPDIKAKLPLIRFV
jgi:hypothetical protein